MSKERVVLKETKELKVTKSTEKLTLEHLDVPEGFEESFSLMFQNEGLKGIIQYIMQAIDRLSKESK